MQRVHFTKSAARPAVLIITLSSLLFAVAGCGNKSAAPEPVRAVKTLLAGQAGAPSAQVFSGDVRARVEVRLGFRVAGKLLSRSVGVGDSVKPGQVLAQLDGQDLRLGEEAAKAGWRLARSQLEQAEADLRRAKELREQGFIGPAELERREVQAKAAKAQLDQAQAQAGIQGNQSGYTQLVAERAGTVVGIEAEPGQVLAAGTPVVRIAQDGPRDAVFAVPESQYGSLKALMGKSNAIKVTGWGESSSMEATLRELSPLADPVTRTHLAKAEVPASFRLGQTISVSLPRAADKSDLVRLPLSAVGESKGSAVVWVVESKDGALTVQPRPVVVEAADGNEVLVTSGIARGERLVAAGVHVLTPGQVVKLYQASAPVSAAASAASK